MKKPILALLIGCMMLCSACGKSEEVKATEELISQIGTVSFSSDEAIQKAQNAFDSLSVEEQKKVENIKTLEDARAAYDALGIQITKDNYSQYLSIDIATTVEDGIDYGIYMGLGKSIGSTVYQKIRTSVSVNGKSSNYDYNDVAVTVKFSGMYIPFTGWLSEDEVEDYMKEHVQYVDYNITANSDIVGNGYAERVFDLEDGYYVFNRSSSVDLQYELVDVTGTMTPIK